MTLRKIQYLLFKNMNILSLSILLLINQKQTMVSLATTKLYTPELISKVPQLKALTNTIQDIYQIYV